MRRISLQGRPFTALAAGVLLMAVASVAHAQATRTWVSGVGNDANPCSRTAPCKTFAGAISKTAPKGEINVLDPGGFGAVTITKSITISSEGFEAGVLVSGTNAIIVNAASTDVIVLRGLDFEGLGTGLSGISFLAGGALFVEKCTINNFVNQGIDVSNAGASIITVKDTIIRNNVGAGANLGGIRLHPTGTAVATLENVRLERNQIGLRVETGGTAIMHNSTAFKNLANGITVIGTGEVDIDSSLVAGNVSNGAAGGGTIKTSNSSFYKNGTNISGVFTTLGGNHSDGSGGTPPAGAF
jgi:hypothetical protein